MSLKEQFLGLLEGRVAGIERLIRCYLQGIAKEGRLKEACSYALLNGGKRFRPALVQMVANALGREGQADEAALAIEFFHTASLIADDLPCMDDDDERRNQPSVHKAYDEATALLASYALIAAGYEHIAKNSRRLGALGGNACIYALENAAFNTGIMGATGGQSLDLFPPDFNLETLREVIHKKTVSLFEVSFVFGWLFGGGKVQDLGKVKQAAGHFGVAFQVVDDLDDWVQDAAKERTTNLAVVLGVDAAHSIIKQELAGYRKTLEDLGVASHELVMLADILEQRLGGPFPG